MRFLIWLFVLASTLAQAQTMGGSSGPVIWSGSLGQVLPSTGLYLPATSSARRVIRMAEDPANGSNYMTVQAPSALSNNTTTFSFPFNNGSVGTVLVNSGSGVSSWSQVDLTNSNAISGVLPLGYGGTNTSLSASAGSVIYSDADSFEVTTVGTSGQYLKSNGTAAPTWSAIDISTASITGVLPLANGGTGQSTKAAAFNALSPMTTAGDIIYGGASGTGTRLAAGTSTQLLHGGTTPSWSAVSLTADITGVLPLANGGTNKNMTAVAGGIVYTDADSQEVTAAGTSGQFLKSAGSGTPVWSAVDLSTASVTGALPIGNGGTGQTTKAAGFDALSPMTNAGDIIYGGTSGTGTRLAAGTSTQLLHGGTTPSWSAISLTADVTGTLPVANGGTGTTTSTGTGNVMLSASPTTTGTITVDAVNLNANIDNSTGNTAVTAFRRSTGSATNTLMLLSKLNTTVANSRLISGAADTGTSDNVRGYVRVNSGGTSLEFEAASDRRIKKDIKNAEGLGVIRKLRPVTYTLKKTGTHGRGFIAQEFAEVFPDVVVKTDDGKGEDLPKGHEPWTMSDAPIMPHLVAAVQELERELKKTQAEFAAYKKAHP